MYKFFITVSLLLHSNNIWGQMASFFEGEIIYDFHRRDKSQKLSEVASDNYFGTELSYTIKNNCYRAENNGKLKLVQIYKGSDTLYSAIAGINVQLYDISTIPSDSVISYKISETSDTIAGYPCKTLEITTKKCFLQYWFNDQIRINPDAFKRHEIGFWRIQLELTNGAFPLKSTAESPEGRMEMTAKSIVSKKIEDDIFTLEKGLPLIPTPK